MSALIKVHQIPRASFETTRSRFFQILHHCSVPWKITPLFFYLKPLYLGEKEPVQVEFSNFWVIGWKFTKLLMSCLELQVSFSLNFGSLFSIMRGNSSVLFYLKLYMIWTKGAHRSAKFQTLNCSHKISPNLYFDRFLRVYKILAKEVPRNYVSWNGRLMQNLKKKTLICCFKNDKNLVKFDPSTQNSQKFSLSFVFIVQSI